LSCIDRVPGGGNRFRRQRPGDGGILGFVSGN